MTKSTTPNDDAAPTPRTDAFLKVEHVAYDAMWITFARQLERELAAAKAPPPAPTNGGHDGLREKLLQLLVRHSNYVSLDCAEDVSGKRVEAAYVKFKSAKEEFLALLPTRDDADGRRLNWLEKTFHVDFTGPTPVCAAFVKYDEDAATLRQAIDAAMNSAVVMSSTESGKAATRTTDSTGREG